MRTLGLWTSVVGFLVIGGLSLLYLFTEMGENVLDRMGSYVVYAEFSNASGIDPGSEVEMAGVQIGRVTAIHLDGSRARVTLNLRDSVRLQADAIASIQTRGLLGGRYLIITPGGSDQLIPPGGKIRETESPLDLPGLISAYISLRNKSNSTPAPTPEQ